MTYLYMHIKLITPKLNNKIKSNEIIMLCIPLLLLLYILHFLFIKLFDDTPHLSQVTNI